MVEKLKYAFEGPYFEVIRAVNGSEDVLRVSEHSGSIWIAYTYHFSGSTLEFNMGPGGQWLNIFAIDSELINATKSKLEKMIGFKFSEVNT